MNAPDDLFASAPPVFPPLADAFRCLPALSIRQPWAWLILHGGKDIENRTWRISYRGRFLVHASQGMTAAEYQSSATFARSQNITLPPAHELERGGIVGSVELTHCVTGSSSPWFFGPYGFLLKDPVPCAFIPCRGRLQFFYPDISKAETP